MKHVCTVIGHQDQWELHNCTECFWKLIFAAGHLCVVIMKDVLSSLFSMGTTLRSCLNVLCVLCRSNFSSCYIMSSITYSAGRWELVASDHKRQERKVIQLN